MQVQRELKTKNCSVLFGLPHHIEIWDQDQRALVIYHYHRTIQIYGELYTDIFLSAAIAHSVFC
jgi:hypothetical protein